METGVTWNMAKPKEFTVARGATITGLDRFENDKPYFSMTWELEEGDDRDEEVAKAIEYVSNIVELIHET